MNRLFVELYFDEDVDILVADLMRARGFTVKTTREEGRLHDNDEAQLAYAVSQQCAVVTHNRTDFENLARLYFETRQTHFGIIIAVRRPPYEIAKRLASILNQTTADEMQNQIRYI
jgi:predicted nuclease of predicted toxin-antitoxin system